MRNELDELDQQAYCALKSVTVATLARQALRQAGGDGAQGAIGPPRLTSSRCASSAVGVHRRASSRRSMPTPARPTQIGGAGDQLTVFGRRDDRHCDGAEQGAEARVAEPGPIIRATLGGRQTS